ncbi:MAG: AAA family ATPase, partial [Acidobacteriota bacterium]|nr:AAA family ATPase [Acidobacteriota bacterium]
SMICIEEPELGLHPDALPLIAELLAAAACKTQIVVTTHSDILLSALSESPESVLVCENLKGSSSIRRLDKDQLDFWLREYKLGEIWRTGELGGNP